MRIDFRRAARLRMISLLVFALAVSACGAGDDTESDVAGGDVGPDSEVESADYFEGESITIIAPAGPGGGADAVSQFSAQIIESFVEGSPSVNIEYIEGGGTVLGINEYARREPDGTTLAVAGSSNTAAWLVDQEGVMYDVRDYTPIFGAVQGRIVYARAETGIQSVTDIASFEEREGRKPAVGDVAPTGGGLAVALAFELLELRDQVDQVFGYEGGGALQIAMEQGELDVASETGAAHARGTLELVESGEMNQVFTLGLIEEDGSMSRDPAYPDVPSVYDEYVELHGEEPSGPAWDALVAVMVSMPHLMLVTHSDAPPEAVEALVAGFEAARTELNDFDEQSEAQFGAYPTRVGDEWDPLLTAMADFDPEIQGWLRSWLEEAYDVSL